MVHLILAVQFVKLNLGQVFQARVGKTLEPFHLLD